MALIVSGLVRTRISTMNFWVLAFFVCAVSAGSYSSGVYKPWKPVVKTVVPVSVTPKVVYQSVQPVHVVAKAVVNPYAQRFESPKVVRPAIRPFPVVKAVVQTIPAPAVQPIPLVKAVAQPSVQPYQAVKAVVVQPAQVAKSVVYPNSEAEATILRSESEVKSDGFNYVYETANGISAQATGALRSVDNSDVLTVTGAYQYKSPEGVPVWFTYVADENGYQPKSDFLPVAPPVPEAIQRALDYVIAHPPKDVAKKF